MYSSLKNILIFLIVTCFCQSSLSQTEKIQKIPVANNKPYKIQRNTLSAPASTRYSYEFTKNKSDQNPTTCEQKNNILDFWCLTTSKISIFLQSLFKFGTQNQISQKKEKSLQSDNQYSWNYKDSSSH